MKIIIEILNDNDVDVKVEGPDNVSPLVMLGALEVVKASLQRAQFDVNMTASTEDNK